MEATVTRTPSTTLSAPPPWPPRVLAVRTAMQQQRWLSRSDTLALVGNQPVFDTTSLTTRLRRAIDFWAAEIQSRWAIDTIRHGARFHWTRDLTIDDSRSQPRLPRAQQQVLLQHAADLLQKGAIRSARPGEQLTNSPLFSVPKRDGTQRPIIDLRRPNTALLAPHFKMHKLLDVAATMPPGSQAIAIDAKDAYLSVPLAERDGQRLSFTLDGRSYVPLSLVFGAAPSPRVYHKLMGKLMQFLRARGIAIVHYLDDLLLWSSPAQIEAERDLALATLLAAGVTLNVRKSQLRPTTRITWLGLTIDSSTRLCELPAERAATLRHGIRRVLHRGARGPLPVRDLARLTGELTFAATAAPLARLATWTLMPLMRHGLRVARQEWSRARASLSREARQVLAFCEKQLHRRSPMTTTCFDSVAPTVWIETDASEYAWGAVLSYQPGPSSERVSTAIQGRWTGATARQHIGELESLAMLLALRTAVQTWDLRRRTVLLRSDSTTCLSIVRRGGSQTPFLRWTARRIWTLALQHQLVLRTQHVPGVDNVVPDRLSRQQHPSATFEVPQALFEQACRLLRVRPTLDLFASRASTRLPCWVSRFHEPGAWAVDALTLDWNQLPAPCYACPPPRMIPRVLARVREMSRPMLLIVPHWSTATFMPLLRSLLAAPPVVLDMPLMATATVTTAQVTVDTTPTLALRQILCCVVCGTPSRAFSTTTRA